LIGITLINHSTELFFQRYRPLTEKESTDPAADPSDI
jgi:hypothetical protein